MTDCNKLFSFKQLMRLFDKEDVSISDHMNEFQGQLEQLNNVGVNFDDNILGLWLLDTLPDS